MQRLGSGPAAETASWPGRPLFWFVSWQLPGFGRRWQEEVWSKSNQLPAMTSRRGLPHQGPVRNWVKRPPPSSPSPGQEAAPWPQRLPLTPLECQGCEELVACLGIWPLGLPALPLSDPIGLLPPVAGRSQARHPGSAQAVAEGTRGEGCAAQAEAGGVEAVRLLPGAEGAKRHSG